MAISTSAAGFAAAPSLGSHDQTLVRGRSFGHQCRTRGPSVGVTCMTAIIPDPRCSAIWQCSIQAPGFEASISRSTVDPDGNQRGILPDQVAGGQAVTGGERQAEIRRPVEFRSVPVDVPGHGRIGPESHELGLVVGSRRSIAYRHDPQRVHLGFELADRL